MRGGGKVYFIKPVGKDGPIKIGCSRDPSTRLDNLMDWSPWPLEIIGTISGTTQDESFLHKCFAEYHSHREWFHSAPELRDEIDRIIKEGDVSAAKARLTPKGTIRSISARRRSKEFRRRMSYAHRIRHVVDRMKQSGAANWRTPEAVAKIMARWADRGRSHPRGAAAGQPPTETEIQILEEYLRDPEKHSVVPEWERKAAA